MKLDDVINNIFKGIKSADKSYRDWTNGYFLNVGPEYYMTSKIAEKIMQNKPSNLLFFEYTIDKIREWEDHKIYGRLPEYIGKKCKFDIAILDSDYHMEYVIEVKDIYGLRNATFYNDIKRLKWIKEQYSKEKGKGSIIAGIFAAYICSVDSSEDKCRDKINKVMKRYVGEFGEENVKWSEKNITETYTDRDGKISMSTYFCIVI